MADAVSLLRELPRHRHAASATRTRFERFKNAHPGISSRLLTDAKPGSDEVSYDILLDDPQSGTIALSWHPDEGVPWTPLYADHWAANLVLTVNDASTSIQSALIYLNGALRRNPNLMEDLVNRSLIFTAMGTVPTIAERKIDKAVSEFRAHEGMSSDEALRRWLGEMHLTADALRELIGQSLQLREFRRALVARRVKPYFEAHRLDFDRVAVFRVEGLSRPSAKSLADAWRRSRTCPAIDGKRGSKWTADGRLQSLYARELPTAFAGKPARSVVGPVKVGPDFCVGQILRRSPARLDAATREKIEDLLFQDWLAEQRSKATIQWHWV